MPQAKRLVYGNPQHDLSLVRLTREVLALPDGGLAGRHPPLRGGVTPFAELLRTFEMVQGALQLLALEGEHPLVKRI